MSSSVALRERLRTVGALLVTFALVGACFALLVVALGPFTQRYRLLTVQSGSMTPTLPVGSVIVVTPQRLEDVEVGDILTFNMPGQAGVLDTHRVVQIIESGSHPVVLTKGDANASPDPWRLRLEKGPAWRVRMDVPHVGYALLWWRQPVIRLIALVFAPLLVAYIWINEVWQNHRARPSGQVGPVPGVG